jgi:sigma-B regulation protein RsbU (phosphoserine phosphatase)
MAWAPSPRILLCGDPSSDGEDLGRYLEKAGYTLSRHDSVGGEPADLASFHLIVVDAGRPGEDPLPACRHLRARLADCFTPILVVSTDHGPAARLANLEAGADAYLLRPFKPGELLAQVQRFLRLKDRHDRLAEKTAEVHRINQRLQRTYQQMDQELELARRIQRSLLPQSLPDLPCMRFAVHYRPCGRVGGDFYDLFRLDEEHLGFYVADAMGHGVPASLLTIFVKKGVRAKEIFGQQYRLVPPGEVLSHLNRELIEQELSESPFITMVYVLLNHQDGRLSFARSGHPYPLYLPHDGPPEQWQVEGSLLGVFDTEFPLGTRQLRPGDKVLLYTDGIDGASYEDHPAGFQSLRACAARHRDLPIQDLVDQLAHELFRGSGQGDDITVLGVEMV